LTYSLFSCPQYDISDGGQPGGGGEYEVQVSGPWGELATPCRDLLGSAVVHN
jgi:hypothetical protein